MSEGPKLTFAGKLAIALFVAACLWGAYALFSRDRGDSADPGNPSGKDDGKSSTNSGPAVEIGIAYGTEKERWLKEAVSEFGETPDGKKIKVNLIPLGSLEGAEAIYAKNDRRIHVWSPASAMYKDVFVQEWQRKNDGKNPIVTEQILALTPMVFVMWEERYQAFIKKYPAVSFTTIREALGEDGGWNAIAKKPEWGLFKFGHTRPDTSNSGLMTLVLMAYDKHQKSESLALENVLNKEFQDWAEGVERGITPRRMASSTGKMMNDFVLYTASDFDAIFVYENVFLDYLKDAEGRSSGVRVIYPQYNMWNDNPYYILDVSWSAKEQRVAAQTFLDFLMSEPIQAKARSHGFRPGNTRVPIVGPDVPDSPFLRYEKAGLKSDLPTMCEPPPADVLKNLLEWWRRKFGSK